LNSLFEPGRKSSAVSFEVTALVAWIASLIIVYHSFGPRTRAAFGPNWEQVAVARSLAAGHGFANPFGESYPTGPTAVLAPVHPAMLGAIFALWGYRPVAAIVALLAEAAIQTAAVVLLLRISMAAFLSWIPGAVAGAAMLVMTWPLPQWENASAWLALESIFLCALVGRRAAWAGVVLGVGWLVSPSLIPASVAAVALLRGWKYTRTSAAVAVVVVAPWMVRNWITFQRPVFLRDNFGLELLVSNNDRAEPRHSADLKSFQMLHPSQNATVVAELRDAGEPLYFNGLQASALEWMRTHPKRFLELTRARIALWWTSSWLIAAVNLIGLAGVWLSRANPFSRAAAACLALYPIPYYVLQFDSRYAWPVLWLAALMAGYTCIFTVRMVQGHGPKARLGLIRFQVPGGNPRRVPASDPGR
jgi:hypothetical protein